MWGTNRVQSTNRNVPGGSNLRDKKERTISTKRAHKCNPITPMQEKVPILPNGLLTSEVENHQRNTTSNGEPARVTAATRQRSCSVCVGN